MERIVLFFGLFLLLFPVTVSSQILEDREAVAKMLAGEKIDGKFRWRPGDKELKKTSLELLTATNIEKTIAGSLLLIKTMTSENYDTENDSLFLDVLLKLPVRIDSLFECAGFISNHFLKTNYSHSQLEQLSFYSRPQSLLYWKKWTPYYMTFLDLPGLDSTLIFLKNNIETINQLHYELYDVPFRFKKTELNVCLARIGIYSDTAVVQELITEMNALYPKNYRWYIENLTKIRTIYSFQRIGEILVSDLGDIETTDEKTFIRQMALAAFLAYVKNFPDRSIKWQDTFNLWVMVENSYFHGKVSNR